MPTTLFKLNPKIHKQQSQSHREPPHLLHIDDKTPRDQHSALLPIRLPPIYRTQILRHKPPINPLLFNQKIAPQSRMVRRFTQFRANKIHEPQKENRSQIQSEQNKNRSVSKIYHNFINKKKDKKTTYLSKVIDRVVNQDIDPWNIENSFVRHKLKHKNSQPDYSSYPHDFDWQRQVLGNYNFRVEPF